MARLLSFPPHGPHDEPDIIEGACWVCSAQIKTMIRKGGHFCSEKCEQIYEDENL